MKIITHPGLLQASNHIITNQPLKLRWCDWQSNGILQVQLQTAATYEEQRADDLAKGNKPGSRPPLGIKLADGLQVSALGYLRHANDDKAQQDLSWLAVLMEAITTCSCPILRTDMLRQVYGRIKEISYGLGVSWNADHSLYSLPLEQAKEDRPSLSMLLANVDVLAEFFKICEQEAASRHQRLKKGYALFYPQHAQ